MRTNTVWLSLGSNEGNREQYLIDACREIALLESTHILDVSTLAETEPWGMKDQGYFLNAALRISTEYSAHELMERLLHIEASLGRIREKKWGPRVIDIDILFFNDEVIEHESLVIPHPGIPARRFVLVNLLSIDALLRHPVNGLTVEEMYAQCTDESEVNEIGELRGVPV